MLKSKEVADLKYISHSEPIIKCTIGKDYLKDSTVDMLVKALEAHELIKVHALKSIEATAKEVAEELKSNLNCEIVQVIGRVITIFKVSQKKKGISKRI
ncbi:MAG: YhbY family RNA-binding protein [Bacilli bacterium]